LGGIGNPFVIYKPIIPKKPKEIKKEVKNDLNLKKW